MCFRSVILDGLRLRDETHCDCGGVLDRIGSSRWQAHFVTFGARAVDRAGKRRRFKGFSISAFSKPAATASVMIDRFMVGYSVVPLRDLV